MSPTESRSTALPTTRRHLSPCTPPIPTSHSPPLHPPHPCGFSSAHWPNPANHHTRPPVTPSSSHLLGHGHGHDLAAQPAWLTREAAGPGNPRTASPSQASPRSLFATLAHCHASSASLPSYAPRSSLPLSNSEPTRISSGSAPSHPQITESPPFPNSTNHQRDETTSSP